MKSHFFLPPPPKSPCLLIDIGNNKFTCQHVLDEIFDQIQKELALALRSNPKAISALIQESEYVWNLLNKATGFNPPDPENSP